VLLLLNLTAALAYVLGAVFMKAAQGFDRLLPAALVFVCFSFGATLQTVAMHRQDIGASYAIVLGFEAISAFALGALFFGESVSLTRVTAVALVGLGVYLLRH
jgi:multidrug transporter EmrE-like cation transporter